jgi:hypothetical protein
MGAAMSDATAGNGARHVAEADTDPAPRGVLTWRSAVERNKLLNLWRLAVFAVFAEQPRCIRLAWVLANLFNIRTGYAYASNGWLAKNTLLQENKMRQALATLESAGAILRTSITHPSGQKQRVIYPATSILPRPTVGQGGEPQQVGHQNLSKRSRLPKTQLEHARFAATIRQNREATARGSTRGLSEDEHAAPPVTQSPPSKRRH